MNTAQSVLIFAKQTCDVHEISVIHWFFQKFNQVVKLGGAFSNNSKFGSTNEWIVIKIVDLHGAQELLLPRDRKFKRSSFSDASTQSMPSVLKQIKNSSESILQPSTELIFTFPSYNIVICFQLFELKFEKLSKQSPHDRIKCALQNTIRQLWKSFQNQNYTSKLSLCIVGHCASYNISYLTYRGEISRYSNFETIVQGILDQVDLIASRCVELLHKSPTPTSMISPVIIPISSTTPIQYHVEHSGSAHSEAPMKRYPCLVSYIQCIQDVFSLVPSNTYTKSILICSSQMDVPYDVSMKLLLQHKVPLSVYLIPEIQTSHKMLHQSMCHVHELKYLVEMSRGSLYIQSHSPTDTKPYPSNTSHAMPLSSASTSTLVNSMKGLSDVKDIPHDSTEERGTGEGGVIEDNYLTVSYLFHRRMQSLTYQLRSRMSVKRLDIVHLHSYMLETSTIEHLLTIRRDEGFVITNIKCIEAERDRIQERYGPEPLTPTHHMSSHSSNSFTTQAYSIHTSPSTRHISPHSKAIIHKPTPEKYIIIQLQKLVSSCSILVYEMSIKYQHISPSATILRSSASSATSAYRPSFSHSASYNTSSLKSRSSTPMTARTVDDSTSSSSMLSKPNRSTELTNSIQDSNSWNRGPVHVRIQYHSPFLPMSVCTKMTGRQQASVPLVGDDPFEKAIQISEGIQKQDADLNMFLSLSHMPGIAVTQASTENIIAPTNSINAHHIPNRGSGSNHDVHSRTNINTAMKAKVFEPYIPIVNLISKSDYKNSAYYYVQPLSSPTFSSTTTKVPTTLASSVSKPLPGRRKEWSRKLMKNDLFLSTYILSIQKKLIGADIHYASTSKQLLICTQRPSLLYVVDVTYDKTLCVTLTVKSLTVGQIYTSEQSTTFQHIAAATYETLIAMSFEPIQLKTQLNINPSVVSKHETTKHGKRDMDKSAISVNQIREKSYQIHQICSFANICHSQSILPSLYKDIIRCKEVLGWTAVYERVHFESPISIQTTLVGILSQCPTGLKQESLCYCHFHIYESASADSDLTREELKIEIKYVWPNTFTTTHMNEEDHEHQSQYRYQYHLCQYMNELLANDTHTIAIYKSIVQLLATSGPSKVPVTCISNYAIDQINRYSTTRKLQLPIFATITPEFEDYVASINSNLSSMLKVWISSMFTNTVGLQISYTDSSLLNVGSFVSTVMKCHHYVWSQAPMILLMHIPESNHIRELSISSPLFEHYSSMQHDPDNTYTNVRHSTITSERSHITNSSLCINLDCIEYPCVKIKPNYDKLKDFNIKLLTTTKSHEIVMKKWSDILNHYVISTASEQLISKYLRMIELFHSIHYTAMLYYSFTGSNLSDDANHDITRSHNSSLDPTSSPALLDQNQLFKLLESWKHTYYEVDLSNMFRQIALFSGQRGGLIHTSAAYKSVYSAFISTIGRKLCSSLHGQVFIDASLRTHMKSMSDVLADSTHYTNLISLYTQMYTCQFYIMYRYDESSPYQIILLPSQPEFMIEKLLSLSLSLNSTRSNDTVEVLLRLDISYPQIDVTVLQGMPFLSTDINNMLADETVRLQSQQVLCKALRQFIAADILTHHLLPMSQLTMDSLLMIQQALLEQDDVVIQDTTLEFVAQSRSRGMLPKDIYIDPFVSSTFEYELRSIQSGFSKKGDVIFTRQWMSKGASAAVPAWILMQFHPVQVTPTTTSSEGRSPSVSISSTTMDAVSMMYALQPTIHLKLSISLKKIEDFSVITNHVNNNVTTFSSSKKSVPLSTVISPKINVTQEDIVKELLETLEICWIRTNQKILLKNLFETQNASPLLIAPPVRAPPTPVVTSAKAPEETKKKSRPPIPTLTTVIKPKNTNSSTSGMQAARSKLLNATMGNTTNRNPSPALTTGQTLSSANSSGDNSAVDISDDPNALNPSNVTAAAAVTASPIEERSKELIFDLSKLKKDSSTNGDPTILSPVTAYLSCSKQGDVTCSLFTGASIAIETAIRNLESLALSQLAIQNNERYFVTKDLQGSVYYMSFETVTDKDSKLIRLNLYGVTSPDQQMLSQLKTLLDHRLVEITAKAISASLMRNATMTMSLLSYLKQAAPSKQIHYRIPLPAYVSDPFLLCVIFRQVLSQITFLSPIKLLSSQLEKSVPHLHECIHPASFGYDVLHTRGRSSISESASFDSFASRSLQKLTRKAHVHADKEDDCSQVHPSLGGVFKEYKVAKKDAIVNGSLAQFQQSDFTFLYNNIPLGAVIPGVRMPPTAAKGSASVSNTSNPIATNLPQGLAILEIYPSISDLKDFYQPSVESTYVMTTGSYLRSYEDYCQLDSTLRRNTTITATSPERVDDTSVITNTSRYHIFPLDQTDRYIHIKFYPTTTMQIQTLVDMTLLYYDQTLMMYSMERLLLSNLPLDDMSVNPEDSQYVAASVETFCQGFNRLRALNSTTLLSNSSSVWDHHILETKILPSSEIVLLDSIKSYIHELNTVLSECCIGLEISAEKFDAAYTIEEDTDDEEEEDGDTFDNIEREVDRKTSVDKKHEDPYVITRKMWNKKSVYRGVHFGRISQKNVHPELQIIHETFLPLYLPSMTRHRNYCMVVLLTNQGCELYSYNVEPHIIASIKSHIQTEILQLQALDRSFALAKSTDYTTMLKERCSIVTYKDIVDSVNTLLIVNELRAVYDITYQLLNICSWYTIKAATLTKQAHHCYNPTTNIHCLTLADLPSFLWETGDVYHSITLQLCDMNMKPTDQSSSTMNNSLFLDDFKLLVQKYVERNRLVGYILPDTHSASSDDSSHVFYLLLTVPHYHQLISIQFTYNPQTSSLSIDFKVIDYAYIFCVMILHILDPIFTTHEVLQHDILNVIMSVCNEEDTVVELLTPTPERNDITSIRREYPFLYDLETSLQLEVIIHSLSSMFRAARFLATGDISASSSPSTASTTETNLENKSMSNTNNSPRKVSSPFTVESFDNLIRGWKQTIGNTLYVEVITFSTSVDPDYIIVDSVDESNQCNSEDDSNIKIIERRIEERNDPCLHTTFTICHSSDHTEKFVHICISPFITTMETYYHNLSKKPIYQDKIPHVQGVCIYYKEGDIIHMTILAFHSNDLLIPRTIPWITTLTSTATVAEDKSSLPVYVISLVDDSSTHELQHRTDMSLSDTWVTDRIKMRLKDYVCSV